MVTVGVGDEGDVLHGAVGEAFDEGDAHFLEAAAGGLDIVDDHGDMAEPAGLLVAVVVGEGFVELGAPVAGFGDESRLEGVDWD
ncbi:hypothetical protein BC936DRAFT_149035 [Jimgerdemannia flammicorona]|uniref:Uncharacterized protein n=1 Tax=Jimgerdemannia flammicorona TaxID=994334 RepID=A0A433D1Q4_9FUNG|nr:hypothetical protein BC936DRAFT_149035 [Jimgerdemannia flammicorona]